MNRIRTFFCCIIIVAALLLTEFASAQQIFPASGSLESYGDGLWNYYRGKTKTTVKRNAPMFEKISGNNRYLLDYTNIKGVDLYLSADFEGNKLALLQILTPFPEYKSCSKSTKDISRSFAEVGSALMGVQFDEKKQCTTAAENDGTVVCRGDDYICVYRLCPETMWAYACSVTTK